MKSDPFQLQGAVVDVLIEGLQRGESKSEGKCAAIATHLEIVFDFGWEVELFQQVLELVIFFDHDHGRVVRD